MIDLPTDDDRRGSMWRALIDLGEIFAEPWALIGAQMVELHALEHGATPPRISTDIDVLVHARRTEVGWLRRRRELVDAEHPAWQGIPHAADGRATLRLLTAAP